MKRFIVVAVLILLLAAGGGAWLWHNQNSKSSSSTSGDNSSWLVIKEWGVRFKLPENLRGDISYTIQKTNDGSSGTPTDTAYLSSKKISSETDGACSLKVINGQLTSDGIGIALVRSMSKLPDSAYGYEDKNIPFGNFWLHTTQSKVACGKDPAIQNLQETIKNQLFELLKSPEEIT